MLQSQKLEHKQSLPQLAELLKAFCKRNNYYQKETFCSIFKDQQSFTEFFEMKEQYDQNKAALDELGRRYKILTACSERGELRKTLNHCGNAFQKLKEQYETNSMSQEQNSDIALAKLKLSNARNAYDEYLKSEKEARNLWPDKRPTLESIDEQYNKLENAKRFNRKRYVYV
jgi:hypothetical protein